MSLLWDQYWPALVAAVVIGIIAGTLAYSPPRGLAGRLPASNMALVIGLLAALALGALWHGPLGAGDRLATRIEAMANAELQRQEMGLVRARLDRGPLTRRLLLSGPADDFQQRELVRIMSAVPGVGSVRWTNPPAAGEAGR